MDFYTINLHRPTLVRSRSFCAKYAGDDMACLACASSSMLCSTFCYGRTDVARHVIGWVSTQETRVQNALNDVAGNGPGRYCSPRHRKPETSRNYGPKSVSMTWRAMGQPRHRKQFHSEMRVKLRWLTWQAMFARPYLLQAFTLHELDVIRTLEMAQRLQLGADLQHLRLELGHDGPRRVADSTALHVIPFPA